jgi:hypothetical protein
MSYKTFCIATLFVFQVCSGNAQEAQQPQSPPPPAKPQASQTRDEGNTGSGLSIEPFYWLLRTNPDLHAGATFAGTIPGNLKFPGKAKRAPGAILTFPAGKGSTLRVSAFRVQGSGNTTAAQELNLFSTDFTAGDALITSYTIVNAKVSWDYLTYPFQLGRAGFRLKTLWEVQYTNIKSRISAPFHVSDAAISPVTSNGSRQVILPTLGLGLENTVSRHFRWEVKGSGFALPHRSDIWDAEGTVAVRVGQFEILGGEKAYHFKTSPKNTQYFATTLFGAYVGLRWYWR